MKVEGGGHYLRAVNDGAHTVYGDLLHEKTLSIIQKTLEPLKN